MPQASFSRLGPAAQSLKARLRKLLIIRQRRLLDGRIVMGAEVDALREKLKNLISEGKKRIVLNMTHIEYVDSSGLGTLVFAHLSAKNQGASLRLSNLGRKFQEVLQLTKLVTVFEVCNTEESAVASFSKLRTKPLRKNQASLCQGLSIGLFNLHTRASRKKRRSLFKGQTNCIKRFASKTH